MDNVSHMSKIRADKLRRAERSGFAKGVTAAFRGVGPWTSTPLPAPRVRVSSGSLKSDFSALQRDADRLISDRG